MDRSKILEEIRLKSLTVNKYIKENAAPVMVSPAAAAGASGAGGGRKPAPTPPGPGPDPGPSYDPSTQAYLDATGITDSTIATKIDGFVTQLKEAGYWDSTIAFFPFVTDLTAEAGNAAIFNMFSYDLKNPAKGESDPQLAKNGSIAIGFSESNFYADSIYNLGPNTGSTGYFTTNVFISNFTNNLATVGYSKVGGASTELVIRDSAFFYKLGVDAKATTNIAWDSSQVASNNSGFGSENTIIISAELDDKETYSVRQVTQYQTTNQAITRIATSTGSEIWMGDAASQVSNNIYTTYFMLDSGLSIADLEAYRGLVNSFNLSLGRGTIIG